MDILKGFWNWLVGLVWRRAPVPVEDSYFRSPAFEKELRGFNREMAAVYHESRLSRSPQKITKARLFLLGKWRQNFVKELRPLDENTRRQRVRALTVEAWRCVNFVKTCEHLQITKRDMKLLGDAILGDL